MASTGTSIRVLRFGVFEMDLANSELRRAGVLVKLSPQQFRLLHFLAGHTGVICSREEIQQAIWGNEVFVDFDRSLNVHIAQIRAALKDDSDAPRFIQTVPRRGYKFVAPVEQDSVPVAEPVKKPIRRWGILLAAAAAVALCAGIAWMALRTRPLPMLAVLPFENLTGRPEDAPVVEGLADELITEFGVIQPERLGVIGRTSVMHYRGRAADLRQIARELGVDYVVEGSLRREDSQVRISIRLIRVNGQVQLWNDTYELTGPSHLELEEQIATRASTAIVAKLFPAASVQRRTRVPDGEAYAAFENGRYLMQNSRAGTRRAIEFFEESAKRDPAFADPLAAMADAFVGLALSGAVNAPEAFGKASESAEAALRIEPDNAEAHNALANVSIWRDWNWNDARMHYERALSINPSLARAHHDYAFYLLVTGHPEQALTSLRRAIALDPLSPQVNIDAGWILLQAHHFNEAIVQAKRALELEPGMREAEACIARAEQYQGKRGQRAMSADITDPYSQALVYASQSRVDEAMRALETAYGQHAVQIPLMKTEPAFLALGNDPRYRELIRKLGL